MWEGRANPEALGQIRRDCHGQIPWGGFPAISEEAADRPTDSRKVKYAARCVSSAFFLRLGTFQQPDRIETRSGAKPGMRGSGARPEDCRPRPRVRLRWKIGISLVGRAAIQNAACPPDGELKEGIVGQRSQSRVGVHIIATRAFLPAFVASAADPPSPPFF